MATASIYKASEIVAARPAGGVGRDKRPRLRDNDRSSATSARHTGQRSKCSSIATRAGRDTQSSTYNESDCLVSSHNIREFPNCQSPIANCQFETLEQQVFNRQLTIANRQCRGWLTDPGCSLFSKEATPTSLGQTLQA